MMRRDLPTAHLMIPNLAPMVDVVMVILVFFMLGASFVERERWFRARLPAQMGPGGTAAVSIVPAIRIDLKTSDDGSCTIVAMDQLVEPNSFAGLAAYLTEKRRAGVDAAAPIVITADPDVPYQAVVSTMDECIGAGNENVQIALHEPLAPATPTETDPP